MMYFMNKKKNNGNKIVFLVFFILLSILYAIQSSYGFKLENFFQSENYSENDFQTENIELNKNELLNIYYLDVGQGDSIFIELPNSETMLIDGAELKEKDSIISFIKKNGYSTIDYLIATHPHADHIGSLSAIINEFTIKNIYMPKVISTSKTYENLLNTISQKNLKVKTAKIGVSILDSEKLKIKFLSPKKDNYQELNNYSAVLQIIYQTKSFLFMGDAEKEVESEITENIKSDVIKVGHHGSNTSSSASFIEKVNPDYAIISVGENNKYNHPSIEVIKRWEAIGAKIFRTDKDGMIKVETDGKNLKILSEIEKRK